MRESAFGLNSPLRLVKELRNFDQALLQVVALWQDYESSPELDRPGAATKAAVQDCRETLLRFKDSIERKYGLSLDSSGPKHWVKDTSKKLFWMKEREDIEALRKKLQMSSESIIMPTLVAVRTSSRLDNSKQEQRIQAVHCLLQDTIELQKETNNQLGTITRRLDAQAESTLLLLENVKNGLATFTRVRTVVFGMCSMLSSSHTLVSEQMAIPKGLDTCWKQAPVTLEDALGALVPIPLELVTSWELYITIMLTSWTSETNSHLWNLASIVLGLQTRSQALIFSVRIASVGYGIKGLPPSRTARLSKQWIVIHATNESSMTPRTKPVADTYKSMHRTRDRDVEEN
ncbi:uncharacterized protein PAC_04239 [Phialocephala subalpina]|uniref:Fungal N-terminal domain-containing protein n=1 Tax=Phialocephala subalpina TaxID=576137 RepID=A0A1L7WNL3_9HELO|nr:uncharacterized protein PAC_04239 [Phialocephala subalpina]